VSERTKPSAPPRWPCQCTPALGAHFLEVLTVQALADDSGGLDRLVAAGVDHFLAVISKPERDPND